MSQRKNIFVITVIITLLLILIGMNSSYSQETESIAEKHKEEKAELREKQRVERVQAKEQKKKERVKKREEHKQEIATKKEERVKQKEEHAKQKEVNKISREEAKTYKKVAKGQIKERKKKLWKLRWRKKVVKVTSSEEDPVYIYYAKVKKGKSEFLKLADAELSYKVKIKNQTPKIINQVQILWKRKKPFTDDLTVARETNVARPLLPYKKRTIVYNEFDSKRQGEIYDVRVVKVVFEDGTQWTNPQSNWKFRI